MLMFLMLVYIFFREKRLYDTISFLLYIILVIIMIVRYYYDYKGAIDMFVLIEHGTNDSVPEIIKNIHITNLFFILYTIVYIIFLRSRKTIYKSNK